MNPRSLLLLIPFITCTLGYFIASSVYKQKSIEAPSLVGLPVQQALTFISNLNLNLRVRDYVHDSELPSGTIIQQIPQAGDPMKPHQTIVVALSERPAWLHAPDLIGKETALISKELELSGIRIKNVYLPSSYPRTMCFAQSPSPGQPLEQNELILYISHQEPRPVIWPCVIGKQYQDIMAFAENYGITIDARSSRAEYLSKDDQIIVAQYPAAGSIILFDSVKPPILQILLK